MYTCFAYGTYIYANIYIHISIYIYKYLYIRIYVCTCAYAFLVCTYANSRVPRAWFPASYLQHTYLDIQCKAK